MHRLIAAKTGWGKSWYAQAIMEANLPKYPIGAVLDYKDEYRGLVKAGFAKHLIVGPAEAEFGVSEWRTVFQQNPRLVLARFQLDDEEWRDVADTVSTAVRREGQEQGGGFIAFEEAHFVAPQSGSVPSGTKGVATTGRGETISSLWATQRLAELEETVVSQQDEYLFGGFKSSADLDKIQKVVEYDKKLHNPNKTPDPHAVPEELRVNGEAIPLRRFKQGGTMRGSEWIYSDDYGTVERRDTRDVSMNATHYGPEGRPIHDP